MTLIPSQLRQSLSLLTLCFIFGFTQTTLANSDYTQEQTAYLEAWEAIKKNDRKAIAKYKKQLKNYSLYPYVLYHDYRRHIKATPNSVIKQFVNKEPSYLGEKLRTTWLEHLGDTKQWQTYRQNYQPQSSVSLQCHYINSLIVAKSAAFNRKAIKLSRELWNNHTKLPKACYPVDNWLRNHGKLTAEMVWNRIALAIKKRQYKRANELKRDLSKRDQKMVTEWIAIVKKPQLIEKPLPNSLSAFVKKRAFSAAVVSYARQEPVLAQNLLNQYAKQYGISRQQKADLTRRIALRAAYKYKDDSDDLLSLVNGNDSKTEETLRWQAQIALKASHWLQLMDVIELMPKSMQQQPQWQYWLARSLDQTLQEKKAKPIYQKLAKQRNYYGFLSADRLKLPYQFNAKPQAKLDKKALLKKYPALQRIQELMAIDWLKSSRVEWYHFLKNADKNDLGAIAVLANQWQAHPYAIRSLALAKEWDQINLRFPTPHKQPVMTNADKNKIDAAWIYGIMRKESAYNADIRSSVGAVGLMQIMPKTAKYIGKKIGVKNTSVYALTEAQNNIELGSAYLRYLADKYDGNMVLATAAYNAGPHRVKQWTQDQKNMPADQWVDTIPFTETRKYVKTVLEYTTIFKSLLNGEYDRLRQIMPPVNETK